MSKEFIPMYKKIEEDIVTDILNGVYREGDVLKGQNEYAAEYNTSRTCIRRALSELIKKGVLESAQGKGTFVKRKDPETGQQRRFKVVEISREKADKRVASSLKIGEGGEVYRLERIRIVDGRAENYQISYISRDLMPDVDFTKEDMEHGSIYYYLSSVAKMLPQYSDERIYAVECPRMVAESFRISKKSPVLLIHRTTYSMDGLVMEYCLDYLAPDINGLGIRR